MSTTPVHGIMASLSQRQLELLRTYDSGPKIHDAADLFEVVTELTQLGLIRPREAYQSVNPNNPAFELTDTGRAVLAGPKQR